MNAASGSKLGIDATKKLPGEGFKRPGRRSS
jgi:3-polyprenyl-4-hydroxybenzoate decarboxylase